MKNNGKITLTLSMLLIAPAYGMNYLKSGLGWGAQKASNAWTLGKQASRSAKQKWDNLEMGWIGDNESVQKVIGSPELVVENTTQPATNATNAATVQNTITPVVPAPVTGLSGTTLVTNQETIAPIIAVETPVPAVNPILDAFNTEENDSVIVLSGPVVPATSSLMDPEYNTVDNPAPQVIPAPVIAPAVQAAAENVLLQPEVDTIGISNAPASSDKLQHTLFTEEIPAIAPVTNASEDNLLPLLAQTTEQSVITSNSVNNEALRQVAIQELTDTLGSQPRAQETLDQTVAEVASAVTAAVKQEEAQGETDAHKLAELAVNTATQAAEQINLTSPDVKNAAAVLGCQQAQADLNTIPQLSVDASANAAPVAPISTAASVVNTVKVTTSVKAVPVVRNFDPATGKTISEQTEAQVSASESAFDIVAAHVGPDKAQSVIDAVVKDGKAAAEDYLKKEYIKKATHDTGIAIDLETVINNASEQVIPSIGLTDPNVQEALHKVLEAELRAAPPAAAKLTWFEAAQVRTAKTKALIGRNPGKTALIVAATGLAAGFIAYKLSDRFKRKVDNAAAAIKAKTVAAMKAVQVKWDKLRQGEITKGDAVRVAGVAAAGVGAYGLYRLAKNYSVQAKAKSAYGVVRSKAAVYLAKAQTGATSAWNKLNGLDNKKKVAVGVVVGGAAAAGIGYYLYTKQASVSPAQKAYNDFLAAIASDKGVLESATAVVGALASDDASTALVLFQQPLFVAQLTDTQKRKLAYAAQFHMKKS